MRERSLFASLLQNGSLLAIRLLLAYGFYAPFLIKLENTKAFAAWLEQLNFSYPLLNAYLVIGLQGTAVLLLIVGLATRFFSLALLYHMAIGLLAVHWHNGFSARENGYEIPLYYILMLFSLSVFGAGKLSFDYLIARHYHKFEWPRPKAIPLPLIPRPTCKHPTTHKPPRADETLPFEESSGQEIHSDPMH